MSASRVKLGALVPLQSNLVGNDSLSRIPIFEGANTVGRCNLSVTDKRVSRKHISLHASTDGSIEVLVEGPNPIIVRSGGERKKICSQEKVTIANGDIMELIPGNYSFKYATFGNENTTSSPTDSSSKKGKRHSEEDSLAVKRNRQILEDEALARTLQSNFAQDNATVSDISGSSQSKPANTIDSKMDKVHPLSIPKEWLPLIFRLMRVQGLPAWANSSSVTIQDVIQGNVLVAVLSNYMVDIDWLLSACPDLKKIPHVLVVHGEGGASLERLQKTKPPNWILHKPPLPISYGTHHSKAMLLVYPQGIRVVVHTANLIYVDWNNKTQGLWMQDFPWKDVKVNNRECSFENDLVDYLRTLKWPEFSVKLPAVGNVAINAAFFKKFDYSSATVRLIASVPGYHMGPNLKKWGHMKMRTVLNEHIFDKEFHKSPLVYQFSSLGSLDERWLNEFASSMSSGTSDDGSPLGIGKPLIIWPTVEDVRCSLEGYAAGNAIPSPQKNVEKDFLKKYWARWKADHVGRCRAMPHIKTYTRYNGQNIAWFLLTSSNLSKAAWGALQKNNTQLMIRSYELGILFLPSVVHPQSHFSCTGDSSVKQPSTPLNEFKTKLATLCLNRSSGTDSSSQVIRLPVPFRLPPQPYTSEDVPWSWDRRYTKKDVHGQVWPRHVQLYTSDDS
ncbi:tyrosyl-DNA phosphodiesterase 1 isoform X2 [Ananas comosus]|uniref:Tyrosyl-DNA phosphodiesterase 1 isoform X2 n=1 Tax=Ananas comosus TaxID=4615 RepID=A0A6P5FM28_ANACO|nr:tyrosyl-DNA phosphodiesterase 1 isoform X2 [Ananas comosus]